MDERDRDILRRSGYAMGHVEKREVPLKLLKDLVDRTLADLSTKEGVATLGVRWTAETYYRKPVLFVAMVPSILGGPFVSFPAWYELALRGDYGRFEPYIRYMVAHEFKHYLQDLAGHYEKQAEMWKRGKIYEYPFEGEAHEYAYRYSGITTSEFLRRGDEATEIIRREAKAGVGVAV